MRLNNIIVFEYGKTLNDTYYPSNIDLELPDICKIQFDFESDLIGEAFNFRRFGNEIMCNIKLKDNIDISNKCLVPKVIIKTGNKGVEEGNLISVSLVESPADKDLINNLEM